MEENKNDIIDIDVKNEEKQEEITKEENPEVIDQEVAQEKPEDKKEATQEKPKASSIIFTIILLVAMVGMGVLSLFLNRCNSNNEESSSSQDYTKYIQESAEYKSKLLEIAAEVLSNGGETLSTPVDELYAYSYDQTDLTNSNLLYTVANDEYAYYIKIEGFNRIDGEDYETFVLESNPKDLEKSASYTKGVIETSYKINFEADKDFSDLYGNKNTSLRSIITKTSKPGEYAVSYSFYTNGDVYLCSVNNYIFNTIDSPFKHAESMCTTFKKSTETLAYFLFK